MLSAPPWEMRPASEVAFPKWIPVSVSVTPAEIDPPAPNERLTSKLPVIVPPVLSSLLSSAVLSALTSIAALIALFCTGFLLLASSAASTVTAFSSTYCFVAASLSSVGVPTASREYRDFPSLPRLVTFAALSPATPIEIVASFASSLRASVGAISSRSDLI